uniref:Uncharacterized protein n=1 Tax=Arion vulgaris TaxID=1028688 RepID=A0A0B7ACV6_9EUPU
MVPNMKMADSDKNVATPQNRTYIICSLRCSSGRSTLIMNIDMATIRITGTA